MTESGKTTLAALYCQTLTDRGETCVVLDPMRDPRWQAEYVTDDQAEFLEIAQRYQRLFMFVDEGGEMIGRFNEPMQWLATRSRHLGHSGFFISQRPSQMAPIVRHQCGKAFLFPCGELDYATFAEEWREPYLKSPPKLQQWEFFEVSKFRQLRRGRVDRETGAVTLSAVDIGPTNPSEAAP